MCMHLRKFCANGANKTMRITTGLRFVLSSIEVEDGVFRVALDSLDLDSSVTQRGSARPIVCR